MLSNFQQMYPSIHVVPVTEYITMYTLLMTSNKPETALQGCTSALDMSCRLVGEESADLALGVVGEEVRSGPYGDLPDRPLGVIRQVHREDTDTKLTLRREERESHTIAIQVYMCIHEK